MGLVSNVFSAGLGLKGIEYFYDVVSTGKIDEGLVKGLVLVLSGVIVFQASRSYGKEDGRNYYGRLS